MASAQIPAFITYHKPGTQPPLYVAGTFSNPPWQPCEMGHTTRADGEYDFKKEVRAEPGTQIQYKFRINGGDWVLKDDGPTVTDSSGNTNHVLEVKPQTESSHEQAEGPEGGASQGGPPSYAKVAAKRLQEPPAEQATNRSGTGTPVSARVAAEVADSAELLHEEVPEREGHEGGGASGSGARRKSSSSMSDTSENAAEVADTAERLDYGADRPDHGADRPDHGKNAILILEPPPGEGRPFKVQPRGGEFSFDHEGYIADKSPLFAHEAVGLYESDEEADQEDFEGEDAVDAAPVEDIDPDNIDLNDPRLERFPSSREDIMDAVRKLETGLQADQPSFDGHARSPVINPSRRGTEDITGDFLLTAPQPASPPTHRPSKKSPRGSVGSIPASASLHSISEAEEDEEQEDNFRPAVVFSNPLKRKPKHLKLPISDEDEGVALPDGVSPRTVKPPRPPIVSPETSPSQSPPSPKTRKSNLAPVGAELGKDKERSLQAYKLHPPQSGNPGHAESDPPKAKDSANPGGPSYARAASAQPTHAEDTGESQSPAAQPQSGEGSTESKTAAAQTSSNDGDKRPTSQFPSARRPSYAEVASSQPTSAEGLSEDKTASGAPSTEESKRPAPQPQTTDNSKDTAPKSPTSARRPSYAEVVASKPKAPPAADDDKAKTSQAPTAESPSTAESSKTTAADKDKDKDKASQLRKRGGGGGPSRGEQVRSPDSGARVPAVQPKRGGGWIKALLRFLFVDMMGGMLRRVLRMVGLGGRRAE